MDYLIRQCILLGISPLPLIFCGYAVFLLNLLFLLLVKSLTLFSLFLVLFKLLCLIYLQGVSLLM